MKEKIFVSEYKNNILAKKSKVFFASLIDFFSTVILTFILFAGIIFPLANVIPSYVDLNKNVDQEERNLKDIVSTTRLQKYDDDYNPISIDNTTFNYIEVMAKTSCYFYDIPYRYYDEESKSYIERQVEEKETFINQESDGILYPFDNISYYYYVFKSKEESLNFYTYNKVNYSSNKNLFLYRDVLHYGSSPYDSNFIDQEAFNEKAKDNPSFNKISQYNILKKEKLDLIVSYLVYNEENSAIKSIYNTLSVNYMNGVQFFIDEVENNYDVYLESSKNYNRDYKTYCLATIFTMFLSYILSFIILNILLPLILKKNRTLGIRVLKLGITRNDEMEPRWYNILIKDLVIFILYFPSIIFNAFFINMLSLLAYPLIGSFTLIQLIIFTMLLGLLSYLYLAINKEHKTISLLASMLIVKNTEEFEAIEESTK